MSVSIYEDSPGGLGIFVYSFVLKNNLVNIYEI